MNLQFQIERFLIERALNKIEASAWRPGLIGIHPRAVIVPGHGCLIPDFIIGKKEDPYLLRWYLIPRNPFFNVYLHCFMLSDRDFALHDHPWLFNFSFYWDGGYFEMLPGKKRIFPRKGKLNWKDVPDYENPIPVWRGEGEWKFRWGRSPHRVMLPIEGRPVWTIFVTGPKVRTWGFYCKNGWVKFKEIVKVTKGDGSEPIDSCPE